MPNWVRTRLNVSKKDYEDICKLCVGPDKEPDKESSSGELSLDFNKIVKMPDDLANTEESGKGDDGIQLCMARMNPDCRFYGEKNDKIDEKDYAKLKEEVARGTSYTIFGIDELEKPDFVNLISKYRGDLGDVLELGGKLIANIIKYGTPTWYSWALKYWGTKWNANDYSSVEEDDGTVSMLFSTAWSFALPAMLGLSRQLPKAVIRAEYADENAGCNAGSYVIEGGEILEGGPFDDGSDDADKMAAKLWGY